MCSQTPSGMESLNQVHCGTALMPSQGTDFQFSHHSTGVPCSVVANHMRSRLWISRPVYSSGWLVRGSRTKVSGVVLHYCYTIPSSVSPKGTSGRPSQACLHAEWFLSVPLHLLHSASNPLGLNSPLSHVQVGPPCSVPQSSALSSGKCTSLSACLFFFTVLGWNPGLPHARQALYQRLAV